jgi:hypothetical protein
MQQAPASPDFLSWVNAASADRDLLVPRLTGLYRVLIPVYAFLEFR